MPDPRDRPLARWGDEMRRARTQHRSKRKAIVAAAAAAALVTATLGTLIWQPGPMLVWNASASSPVGLYAIGSAERVRAGGMAAAWPPQDVRRLAAERRYLPSNVPLVKRVAAAQGDRVCAVGEAVFVNGLIAGHRHSHDPSGRPLPTWTGCHELSAGELLLLTPDDRPAFDGRYFGVTRPEQVIGEARLIWPA